MREVLYCEVKSPIMYFLTKLFYPDYRKLLWQGNKSLTWDDFMGKPDSNSPHDASIRWNISFSLDVSFKNWKIKVKPLFECYMDRYESWVKDNQQSDYLLSHEQLHFDIAEIFTRKMRKKCSRIKSSVFLRWFKYEKIYYSYLDACRELQTKYDMETNHSKNRIMQKIWQKYVKKELTKYK